MRYKRQIVRFALYATALLGSPSAALAGEPLIVSTLGDPDPGLVPLPEPKLKFTTLGGPDEAEQGIDAAVERLGHVLGDGVLAQQQATEAHCQSAAAARGRATERYAWAADCLYSRH